MFDYIPDAYNDDLEPLDFLMAQPSSTRSSDSSEDDIEPMIRRRLGAALEGVVDEDEAETFIAQYVSYSKLLAYAMVQAYQETVQNFLPSVVDYLTTYTGPVGQDLGTQNMLE